MEKRGVLSPLATLAQETRLDISRPRVRPAEEGLAARAIGSALDVRSPMRLLHSKKLKSAGVVGCRREGRSLI
jgi:hypothetical protein